MVAIYWAFALGAVTSNPFYDPAREREPPLIEEDTEVQRRQWLAPGHTTSNLGFQLKFYLVPKFLAPFYCIRPLSSKEGGCSRDVRGETSLEQRTAFACQTERRSSPEEGQLAVSHSTGVLVRSLYSTLRTSSVDLKGELGGKSWIPEGSCGMKPEGGQWRHPAERIRPSTGSKKRKGMEAGLRSRVEKSFFFSFNFSRKQGKLKQDNRFCLQWEMRSGSWLLPDSRAPSSQYPIN